MGVEVATFVSDFQASNPGSTDLRSQGDDHLRLIKLVLQDTFPNASKAFYFPSTVAKSASFSVLATDMHKVFMVASGAGAAVVMTLPVLVAGDAGWECTLYKSSGTAPVLVTPPSGTISSGELVVPAARRCINGKRLKVWWTGTGWVVDRNVYLPLLSCIEVHAATLIAGYEWPNGQVLASVATNYPELNAAFGTGATLDKRGRVGIALDNLGGSAAGRLGTIINGTGVGNTGGTETVTISLAQTPTGITSAGNNFISVLSADNLNRNGSIGSVVGGGAANNFQQGGTLGIESSSGTNAIAVTSNNTSGAAHSNLMPSIMVSQMLVVE